MDIRTPISTNGGDWIIKFGEIWKSQVEALKAKFASAIEEVKMPGEYPTDVPIVFVKKDSIIEVLKFMKADAAFDYQFLADVTATDEEDEPRFRIVYNLYSPAKHYRFRLKLKAAEGEEVPTATSVWPAADWAEREVWDMFG